jgi:putative two-component system response regulator
MLNEPVKILAVDDEPLMRSLIGSIFGCRTDCRLEVASDGAEGLSKLFGLHPHLLITDLKMPELGGEALTERALEFDPDMTILVMTANASLEGAVKLMKRGVFDYVTKPILVDDFIATVDRAIEKIRLLPMSRDSLAIVGSLMTALETKDPYLKNHSSRVAEMTRQLSLDLGFSTREALFFERAALVHDLGKIGVPETILNKKGPLTREEFELVKKHPGFSAAIIEPLKEFRDCVREVYHHHERIDGTGYPDRISGKEIPIGARIISVCDAFDAMASHRPYRPALTEGVIHANLLEGRGKQLDGDVVDVFLKTGKR